MSLVVKVDTRKLTAALLKAPGVVKSSLRKSMGTAMSGVSIYAKRNHRFTSRSGNLARSIKSKVSKTGLEGEVYLQSGIAPYGEPVHEGWRRGRARWRPDKFLDESLRVNKQEVINTLKIGYNDALAKAGLR
jgi:hypothetical protein